MINSINYSTMIAEKYIILAVQVLLIAGALNWGLVAYNGTDIVRLALGAGQIERIIKFTIAAAGIFSAYKLYQVYSQ